MTEEKTLVNQIMILVVTLFPTEELKLERSNSGSLGIVFNGFSYSIMEYNNEIIIEFDGFSENFNSKEKAIKFITNLLVKHYRLSK